MREVENPFEAVRWQAVLGNEPFVQKLRDRLSSLRRQRREIPSLRRIGEDVKQKKCWKGSPKSSRWKANECWKKASANWKHAMWPCGWSGRADADRYGKLENSLAAWIAPLWRRGFAVLG